MEGVGVAILFFLDISRIQEYINRRGANSALTQPNRRIIIDKTFRYKTQDFSLVMSYRFSTFFT